VFLQWVLDLSPIAEAAQFINEVREKHSKARSEVIKLRRTLQQLEETAVKHGILQA